MDLAETLPASRRGAIPLPLPSGVLLREGKGMSGECSQMLELLINSFAGAVLIFTIIAVGVVWEHR